MCILVVILCVIILIQCYEFIVCIVHGLSLVSDFWFVDVVYMMLCKRDTNESMRDILFLYRQRHSAKHQAWTQLVQYFAFWFVFGIEWTGIELHTFRTLGGSSTKESRRRFGSGVVKSELNVWGRAWVICRVIDLQFRWKYHVDIYVKLTIIQWQDIVYVLNTFHFVKMPCHKHILFYGLVSAI